MAGKEESQRQDFKPVSVGGRKKRERSENSDGDHEATPSAKRAKSQQKLAVFEGERRKRGRPKGSKNKMSKAEKEAQTALSTPLQQQGVDHTLSMDEQPEEEDFMPRPYAYPVHNDGFYPHDLDGTNVPGTMSDANVGNNSFGMGNSSGKPSSGDADYSGLVDAIQQSLQGHDVNLMVR